MSKKDSHKKTDLNADKNNQIPLKLNEMDENVSGRFCEWSEFLCHIFQDIGGISFNILYANKNKLIN